MAGRVESNSRERTTERVAQNRKGDREDNKSSKGDENGVEVLSKFCRQYAKGVHEVGGIKIGEGSMNRGKSVVRSQDDIINVEQPQAIMNGEESNSRGELTVMACQSGKGDSDDVKDSEDDVIGEELTSQIQNKASNDSSKQRRRRKYVMTDNAHYERDKEDTGYSISDSDIAHRNEIICREVEEMIEFGAKLGLVFKEDGQVKAQDLLEKNKNINRRKA